MIISKSVYVTINSANYKFLKDKNYTFDNIKDIISVKIEDLSKGSHSIVEVKCDFCDFIRDIVYKDYLARISNQNKYACSKCRAEKTKNTVNKKYAVDNIFQCEETKEKIKSTCKSKYGVEYYTQAYESKEKYKEYCQNNYRKDNLFQVELYKNKSKNTSIEKYGVEFPMQSKIVKDKLKESFVAKYGVEHPMMLEEIVLKCNSTKIKNGNISKFISDYRKYRNKVQNKTKKYKAELFEKWDGVDYYDNEFIKNNLNLHYNNPNYPTIDHKISVLHGFIEGLSIDFISNIDNLCITKKSINSSKGSGQYKGNI